MIKKKKTNKLRNYVDLYYGSSNKFVTKGTEVKIWKTVNLDNMGHVI